jgi:hypothetical protein
MSWRSSIFPPAFLAFGAQPAIIPRAIPATKSNLSVFIFPPLLVYDKETLHSERNFRFAAALLTLAASSLEITISVLVLPMSLHSLYLTRSFADTINLFSRFLHFLGISDHSIFDCPFARNIGVP